jgi:hypothetical protein
MYSLALTLIMLFVFTTFYMLANDFLENDESQRYLALNKNENEG